MDTQYNLINSNAYLFFGGYRVDRIHTLTQSSVHPAATVTDAAPVAQHQSRTRHWTTTQIHRYITNCNKRRQ